MNLDPYRAFVVELAERSGDLIRPYFGRADLVVELKADQSPVTAADRGAEALMRDLIHRAFPEHGIIGEELGSERPEAEFVWVLDPIDGTKSFASAVPLFVTLIALLHRGEPVLGCIHQPILRQLLIGDGRVTTLNGQPVRTRQTHCLEEATLLTSDPLNPAKYQDGPAFDRILRRARLARTWGDGYGYLLVATGWADVMCDPIMNPWDIAALVPVIRGAGGKITDWAGEEPMLGTSIVASGTAELHAEMMAALKP